MPGPVGTATAKLLIVDDEPPIADTLAAIFRMHGYEVCVAYSAEEAIETIAEVEPNLALVDVMLPGMNGIDFGIVVRDNRPACQVLLFSGHESTEMLLEEAARKGHRFDILAKPVHPTQILETVKSLLASADRNGGLLPRLS